jgi:hypothetical protein
MPEAATMPSLAEALRWVGADVRALDGGAVGEVNGFFVDSLSGEPAWLIAKLGRWRSTRLVAVPLRNCAGAAFGVWVAADADLLGSAPVVDPTRPLRREHELTICSHFGIGAGVGRAAEVAGRGEGEVTASPPGD